MKNDNDQQKQLDGNQLGHLVIKRTDAPFPFEMIESATVNSTKVEILKVIPMRVYQKGHSLFLGDESISDTLSRTKLV
jgi:hypothetical protein